MYSFGKSYLNPELVVRQCLYPNGPWSVPDAADERGTNLTECDKSDSYS